MRIRPLIAVLTVLLFIFPSGGFAQKLGPVKDYMELVRFVDLAEEGDTLLISGKIQADETIPLSTQHKINITSVSGQPAELSGLHLVNAQITFSDISLVDSLIISGSSNVMLSSNVDVYGDSKPAIDFSGNGELIINPTCTVTALSDGEGVHIQHEGGTLYAALEGIISGGNAFNGGVGVHVSPLRSEGMLLIGGEINGGTGTDIGGNAVNLYDISGNAYISVTGEIKGGNGFIGGDGLQIISTQGTSNIGIFGHIEGGHGNEFGGNGMLVMNTVDQSAISLGGELVGGNSSVSESNPGQSLLLIGSGVINHMYTNECILEDGQVVAISNPLPETAVKETAANQTSESAVAAVDGVKVESSRTVSAEKNKPDNPTNPEMTSRVMTANASSEQNTTVFSVEDCSDVIQEDTSDTSKASIPDMDSGTANTNISSEPVKNDLSSPVNPDGTTSDVNSGSDIVSKDLTADTNPEHGPVDPIPDVVDSALTADADTIQNASNVSSADKETVKESSDGTAPVISSDGNTVENPSDIPSADLSAETEPVQENNIVSSDQTATADPDTQPADADSADLPADVNSEQITAAQSENISSEQTDAVSTSETVSHEIPTVATTDQEDSDDENSMPTMLSESPHTESISEQEKASTDVPDSDLPNPESLTQTADSDPADDNLSSDPESDSTQSPEDKEKSVLESKPLHKQTSVAEQVKSETVPVAQNEPKH